MDIEQDNLRHKREQEDLRKKRRERKQHKTKDQLEKERRRREHQQQTLKKYNKGREGTSGSSSSKRPSSSHSSSSRPGKSKHKPKPPPPPPSAAQQSSDTNNSKFQSLFSSRTQGFLIELNFRNAPPRPPVGPCFVGLGLDGELNDKWTRYKPENAIEANYSWKLHAEPDLGVPLAPSAMDYEGCYVDPLKTKNTAKQKRKKQKKPDAYDDLFEDMDEESDDEEENPVANKPLAPLHPDDDALINWKGSMGDSVAEDLQRLRDKARAEARLGHKVGSKIKGKLGSNSNNSRMMKIKSPIQKGGIGMKRNGKDFQSRVLDENNPFFMKKTTYLANDHSQKVHDFKSLAQSKEKMEKEISAKLSMKKTSDKGFIEQSFVAVKANNTSSANSNAGGGTTSGTKRKHPSKENVEAVYEIPLLPDDKTWGHNFIHVVLDSLPKDSVQKELTDEKLERAFIADVNKGDTSQRMECNLLLASGNKNEDDYDDDDENNDALDRYDVLQKYDLDVIPLKEADTPHAHFLFVVDEESGVATYHPISSRVQLSTGRPSEATSSRLISKRMLNDEETATMEEKLAEVDADLGDKYKDEEHGDDEDDDDDEDISQQPKSLYPFAAGN
eukprot:CAMPEP_0203667282 /NCGR_PEP_ID=MMETSP0090-20130426/4154_1 /ASSEMBLY_ACC=CAM_ASM_001088 /TAXON_ID=426623 /ORGANISM="Chaetoceros affinis, Strain CCMP159" /LENGTH=613 /DNA_ID=CAMNT_0050531401 /DNA_START=124 /DNA_END=1962 /DNA_ORIENTATION=-